MAADNPMVQVPRVEDLEEKQAEEKEETDDDESASHSDESVAEEADTESHKDDKVNLHLIHVQM